MFRPVLLSARARIEVINAETKFPPSLNSLSQLLRRLPKTVDFGTLHTTYFEPKE
jgi:hypothetical protein